MHRIYEITDYESGKYYINDFGSLYGLNIFETNKDEYERIKSNQGNEAWDYSIVPEEPEEIITYKDKKLVLLHSRCMLL